MAEGSPVKNAFYQKVQNVSIVRERIKRRSDNVLGSKSSSDIADEELLSDPKYVDYVGLTGASAKNDSDYLLIGEADSNSVDNVDSNNNLVDIKMSHSYYRLFDESNDFDDKQEEEVQVNEKIGVENSEWYEKYDNSHIDSGTIGSTNYMKKDGQFSISGTYSLPKNDSYTLSQSELLGHIDHNKAKKYFGEKSKDRFFDTYKVLNRHVNICSGKHDELRSIIGDKDDENILKLAASILYDGGVLTPRPMNTTSLSVANVEENNFNDNEVDSKITHENTLDMLANEVVVMAQDANEGVESMIADDISKSVSVTNIVDEEQEDEPDYVIVNINNAVNDISLLDSSIVASAVIDDKMSAVPYLELLQATVNDSIMDEIEEVGYIRDDLSDFDEYRIDSVESYASNSPRAHFILGCIEQNIPPRAVALLRKHISSKLNVAHMGLGDKVGILLSKSLTLMPVVTSLVLTNNNFTDTGLTAIILSLVGMPLLTELDISANKMGENAASALSSYLGSDSCRLKKLLISDTDVDDYECANFIDSLSQSNVLYILEELDLSKNKLGKEENLNAVRPELVTGGESMAKFLSNPKTIIKKLNLHWNMIRMEGAVALCGSVRTNTSLISLNISYNSIAREGAMVLADALLSKECAVQELDISNNNIDGIGCFCIAVACMNNTTIRTIKLDENPIGELGGRVMVELLRDYGDKISISCRKCDISMHLAESIFNYDNLYFSEYALNLEDKFHRCVVLQVLHLCAADPALKIETFKYLADEGDAKNSNNSVSVNLTRYSEEIVNFSQSVIEDMKEVQHHISLGSAASMDLLEKLFNEHCHVSNEYEHKGTVHLKAFRSILKELGLNYSYERIKELASIVDIDDDNALTLSEIKAYISNKALAMEYMLAAMTKKFKMGKSSTVVGEKVYKPYELPAKGSVYIQLGRKIKLTESVERTPLSSSKAKQMIKLANDSLDPLRMLRYSLQSPGTVLYYEQARDFITEFSSQDDITHAIEYVIPFVYSCEDVNALLKSFLGTNFFNMRWLSKRMGNLYDACTGSFNKFFALDLSKHNDYSTHMKLVKYSSRQAARRKKNGSADTSQNGDWSCFRNIYYLKTLPTAEQNDPTLHLNEKTTDAADANESSLPKRNTSDQAKGDDFTQVFTNHIPREGYLEYDYFDPTPMKEIPNLSYALNNTKFYNILRVSNLLKAGVYEDFVTNRYKEVAQYIRKSNQYRLNYHIPIFNCKTISDAHDFGTNLRGFYTAVPRRRNEYNYCYFKEQYGYIDALSKHSEVDSNADDKADSKEHKAQSKGSHADDAKAGKVLSRPPSRATISKGSGSVANAAETAVSEDILTVESLLQIPALKNKQCTDILDALFNTSKFVVKEGSKKFRKLMNGKLQEIQELDLQTKIKIILEDSSALIFYKNSIINSVLEYLLSTKWLLVKQVVVLLQLYTDGTVLKTSFGTYRVELLIKLFPRILDIYNIEIIYTVLNPEEIVTLIARIGYLNLVNPLKIDGYFSLSLSIWEERQMAKMLIYLADEEPGRNWADASFSHIVDDARPGWELNLLWLQDTKFFESGYLSLQYLAIVREKTVYIDTKARFMCLPLVSCNQMCILTDPEARPQQPAAPSTKIISESTVNELNEAMGKKGNISWKF
jgi:hypothetical protein